MSRKIYIRRHKDGALHEFWTGDGWSHDFHDRLLLDDDHEVIAAQAHAIMANDPTMTEEDEIALDADTDINHFLYADSTQGYVEIELMASENAESQRYPNVILASDLGVAWVFKLTTGNGTPRAALVEFHHGDYHRTIDLGAAALTA